MAGPKQRTRSTRTHLEHRTGNAIDTEAAQARRPGFSRMSAPSKAAQMTFSRASTPEISVLAGESSTFSTCTTPSSTSMA